MWQTYNVANTTGEVAVNECSDGSDASAGCSSYIPVLPSARVSGEEGKQGCKICGHNMAAFMMSSTCDFGWGGYIVLGAFITASDRCFGCATLGFVVFDDDDDDDDDDLSLSFSLGVLGGSRVRYCFAAYSWTSSNHTPIMRCCESQSVSFADVFSLRFTFR
jgi:hypothetical protein